ncbi:MAG: hypothetical protein CMJ83_09760 [Planctomycetes bacterium]|nr:hypothetical protein [Planctomycetota bacterium]
MERHEAAEVLHLLHERRHDLVRIRRARVVPDAIERDPVQCIDRVAARIHGVQQMIDDLKETRLMGNVTGQRTTVEKAVHDSDDLKVRRVRLRDQGRQRDVGLYRPPRGREGARLVHHVQRAGLDPGRSPQMDVDRVQAGSRCRLHDRRDVGIDVPYEPRPHPDRCVVGRGLRANGSARTAAGKNEQEDSVHH